MDALVTASEAAGILDPASAIFHENVASIQLDRNAGFRILAPLTLRGYANLMLHFVRWWSRQPGVDVTVFKAEQFTEATLVDYVRDQVNEQPKPSPDTSINTLSCCGGSSCFIFSRTCHMVLF